MNKQEVEQKLDRLKRLDDNQKRYRQSEKGKKANSQFYKSKAGKEILKRYSQKRCRTVKWAREQEQLGLVKYNEKKESYESVK